MSAKVETLYLFSFLKARPFEGVFTKNRKKSKSENGFCFFLGQRRREIGGSKTSKERISQGEASGNGYDSKRGIFVEKIQFKISFVGKRMGGRNERGKSV